MDVAFLARTRALSCARIPSLSHHLHLSVKSNCNDKVAKTYLQRSKFEQKTAPHLTMLARARSPSPTIFAGHRLLSDHAAA